MIRRIVLGSVVRACEPEGDAMSDDPRGCHGLVLRTILSVLDAQTGSNVVGGGGGKTTRQQRSTGGTWWRNEDRLSPGSAAPQQGRGRLTCAPCSNGAFAHRRAGSFGLRDGSRARCSAFDSCKYRFPVHVEEMPDAAEGPMLLFRH